MSGKTSISDKPALHVVEGDHPRPTVHVLALPDIGAISVHVYGDMSMHFNLTRYQAAQLVTALNAADADMPMQATS